MGRAKRLALPMVRVNLENEPRTDGDEDCYLMVSYVVSGQNGYSEIIRYRTLAAVLPGVKEVASTEDGKPCMTP